MNLFQMTQDPMRLDGISAGTANDNLVIRKIVQQLGRVRVIRLRRRYNVCIQAHLGHSCHEQLAWNGSDDFPLILSFMAFL